jgi:hypothetical protein
MLKHWHISKEIEMTKSKQEKKPNFEPIHVPKKVNLVGYQDSPIYLGPIKDEVKAPLVPPCFQGAWYRKAVSSKDAWIGIEATITLPEFLPDEAWRVEGSNRFLDNPSIYFGGFAGAESDAGLTWSTVGEAPECLIPMKESLAFRPFWRYIDGEQNTWENSDFRHPEHYYLPGDTLRISVFSPREHFLQMQIEVIKATTIEKYVERRKTWRIKDDMPANYVTSEFPSVGHLGTSAEFKRVNAIDQSRNEGKPARKTKASVTTATWHEVFLYRKIEGTISKVPFTQDRFASMACPDSRAFTISDQDDLGGETVAIHPGII